MKLKYKLLLDGILFGLIWLVMVYNLTGNLVHEIAGVVLLLGFLLHVFLNRRYYFVMTKQIFQPNVKGKNKIGYGINVVLLVATVGMTVSSLIISKDLFAVINYNFNAGRLWKNIHVVSAVIILICVLLHILMHVGLFSSLVKRNVQTENVQKLILVGSRMLAVVLAIAVIKMSFHNVSVILTDRGHKQWQADAELQDEFAARAPQTEDMSPGREEVDIRCRGILTRMERNRKRINREEETMELGNRGKIPQK